MPLVSSSAICFLYKQHLRDIVVLVSDDHNESNITIKLVTQIGFLVHIKGNVGLV